MNKIMMKTMVALMVGTAMNVPAFADGLALPPQALPPLKPQDRPVANDPATTVIIESDKEVQAKSNVNERTRREILAMLTDEVAQADNIAVIDGAVEVPTQPSVATVADQPRGDYRIFVDIAPNLNKGKAIVKLQLRKGGHVGDANNVTKPIAEVSLAVDPNNVRGSQAEVQKFLNSQLKITNNQAQDQPTRPNVKMWIEVTNQDGSAGVKVGSNLVIYYQPTHDTYINLYYLNEKDDIHRLIPSAQYPDNFVKANQIYRYPADGSNLTITGGNETDRLRAIVTTIPSGISGDQVVGAANLRSRTAPVAVIPTTYPTTFADQQLTRFFSLPTTMWSEKEISYTIGK